MSILSISARYLKSTCGRQFRISLASCRRTLASKYTACREDYISLEREISLRRAEARCSLLVQVNSEASCSELVAYCQHFGTVDSVYHYTLSKNSQNFMLVKFSDESEVENILNAGSCHRNDAHANPIRTPFLWFKANNKKLKPQKEIQLATRDGCKEIGDEQLIEDLQACKDVSEQVQLLCDRTSLNDLGTRLRYMVARQVEVVLNNLHANISIVPFGSSVNGFGRMGCDLDLVLNNSLQEDAEFPERRLIFHTKKWSDGPVEKWRRHLELASDILRLCVPGCARVIPILNARIPIVKYTNELVGVECDLCASHMSGVHMSELLHLYGGLDRRVRPLVFAVRKWASAAGLTSASPGPWITNFPLTLMALFFLQQDVGAGAVLPSMKYLVDKAGKDDIRITEDLINCTFLRDIKKIPKSDITKNESDLSELLLQFFEFYSKFDFEEHAISIVSGKATKKPAHSSLYIVNPLEQSLNVSRNVSFKECNRMRLEIRNAAWTLESNLEKTKKTNWGIIELLENRSKRAIKELVRVGNSHRLVKVSELFKEDSDEKIEQEINMNNNDRKIVTEKNTKIENKKVEISTAKSKEKNQVFKNSQVEKQVRKIKQENVSLVEEARRKIMASSEEKSRVRR